MTEDDIPLVVSWEKKERPYPWGKNQFAESLVSSTQHALVWQSEKGILAYAVVQSVMSEVYLLNIMVKPDFQQQGIGTRVMNELTSWVIASGAKVIILDVDENNLAARSLYEKAGFYILQRRPGAYPRGETALTMRKNL